MAIESPRPSGHEAQASCSGVRRSRTVRLGTRLRKRGVRPWEVACLPFPGPGERHLSSPSRPWLLAGPSFLRLWPAPALHLLARQVAAKPPIWPGGGLPSILRPDRACTGLQEARCRARRAKAGPAGRRVRRPAYRAAATTRPRPAASAPGLSLAKPGPGAARTHPHADATAGGR